jgi:ATP-binding cassette subfamily C protein
MFEGANDSTELFGDAAAHIKCDARSPFFVSGSPDAWIVVSGHVDLFFVELSTSGVSSSRTHVLRVGADEAIFGSRAGLMGDVLAAELPADRGLLAVATNDSRLLHVSASALGGAMADETRRRALVARIERWVAALGGRIGAAHHAKSLVLARPGEAPSLAAGAAVGANTVAWAGVVSGACCAMGDSARVLRADTPPFPLATGLWLTNVGGEAQLRLEDSQALFADGRGWPALAAFHRISLEFLAMATDARRRSDRLASARQEHLDDANFSRALARVGHVLDHDDGLVSAHIEWADDPLVLACERIAETVGASIRVPHEFHKELALSDQVAAIAGASGMRFRRVKLGADWWRSEAGPLLCFGRDDAALFVALPSESGQYELIDPVTGRRELLSGSGAGTLRNDAFTFYRSFPQHRIGWRDLVRMVGDISRGDLRRLRVAGTAAALLGLAAPIAVNLVISSAIPFAEVPQLMALTAIMLLAALGAAAFNALRAVAIARIEIKSDSALQSAVWDHLLRLPAAFFRAYTAGDLADRAMGINTMRQIVSDVTLTALLAGLFSLFNILLIFFYDVRLALVAVLLTLVAGTLIFLCARLQLRHTRVVFQLRGKINGMVLQFLNGITKLRAGNAERRAFALWAEDFAHQRRENVASFEASILAQTIGAGLPAIASIALFATVAYARPDISIGSFVAVTSAFAQFLVIAVSVANSIGNSLVAVPLYERMKPILDAAPEVAKTKEDPGRLRGKVDVSRVSFRYVVDGPPTLEDISLHAEPGEFIALVGASGSGKSTVLRLLLGFEQPEFGNVYFDDKDLAKLDLRAARRQMGVVVQNASLLPGDVFTNIVGSANYTLDDAWEAARMAGLDKDIEAMPMGMQTMISEGMSTISGGQRQRLLIARALVRRPHLVLFDEATSALDNRTQAIVTESLERLHATRIVIAHRLSTIQKADRIYVLSNGRVVENGRFNALMAKDGAFAALARRQLA